LKKIEKKKFLLFVFFITVYLFVGALFEGGCIVVFHKVLSNLNCFESDVNIGPEQYKVIIVNLNKVSLDARVSHKTESQ
jgi:hypothetical protein